MTSAGLLAEVASALNACRDAGLRVKVGHGAVYTSAGYVLPVGPGKSFRAIPVPPGPDVADLDFDDILE